MCAFWDASTIARFTQMLRTIDTENEKISRALVYVMDYCPVAALSLADLIVEHMLNLDVPLVPNKLAILFLVNDILWNKNAPVLRIAQLQHRLESRLIDVFGHLADQITRVSSVHRRRQAEEYVDLILEVWEERSLFNRLFIAQLRETRSFTFTENEELDGEPLKLATESDVYDAIEDQVRAFIEEMTNQSISDDDIQLQAEKLRSYLRVELLRDRS